MPLVPLSKRIETYFLANGKVAANCFLKFYEPNFLYDTPIFVFAETEQLNTESDDIELLQPDIVRLSAGGIPQTSGSATTSDAGHFIISIDRSYQYAIYENLQDAIDNNISNANLVSGIVELDELAEQQQQTQSQRFLGQFTASGTAEFMPQNVTVSKTPSVPTGSYTVVHQYDLASYTVYTALEDTSNYLTVTKTPNNFTIEIKQSADDSPVDAAVGFEIVAPSD